VLPYLIALFRFGLEDELVNDGGGVAVLAEAGAGLLQVLNPVGSPGERADVTKTEIFLWKILRCREV